MKVGWQPPKKLSCRKWNRCGGREDEVLPKLEMVREATASTSGTNICNEEKGTKYGWLRFGNKGYAFRSRGAA